MAYLLARIVFTVAFSHLLRYSQARTARPLHAAGINYLVATLLCGAWTASAARSLHPHTAGLGAIGGAIYVSSLVLMLPAMRQSGVAITGAILQLSLMVPVGFAIWRFREIPSPWQGVGVVLTMVALPLLSLARAPDGPEERLRSGCTPLSLLLFASAGASQVVMKEFTAARPQEDLPLYSTALFATATACTWLWMRLSGDTGRPDLQPVGSDGRLVSEWSVGTALGLVNTLQLAFLLLALRELPAVIVFPVSAALGIVCNTLAAFLLWNERPPLSGWLGIGLAIAAVVLLNLPG